MAKANVKIRVGRDAKTGKFVTPNYVKKHPSTTITQTITKKK